MTVSELKEYIYNKNKVPYILEQLNCHNIKYNEEREYYNAAFPDGDNPMGVNVRNNKYLNYHSFSRNVSYEEGQDLINLVETIKKISFIESVKYIHRILNLQFELRKKEENSDKKKDLLYNTFKKHRSGKKIINVDDIHVLDDKLINDYIPMLHIDWYREGVMPWTRKKFNLAYSYRYNRVVIPHKYWLTGELLGFNMRTTVPNWDEFGIKKYILTSGYNKSLNLYGLYENYDSIQKAKYVVVAESEKSALKRDSLKDETVVSLSGKNMSDEQYRILLGLNVEIIIALDSDVDINEVRHMCEKFYRKRRISYIRDKWGILGDKEAPMDTSNKNYQFLFDNRIRYDESEHRKYLESLKK